jgi:serine/threonine protein kinase
MNFPYQQICDVEGCQSLMSFNLGTPGVEQKISILGYDKNNTLQFFAKYSQKPLAMELSQNEIHVLETLRDTGLVPQLYTKSITDDFVFFKTEYVKGTQRKTIELTNDVYGLLIQLSNFHLTQIEESSDGMKLSLAHGDFCPWNILFQKDEIRLIDWEMAKDRPLGYDLFTYIFQPSFLLKVDMPVNQVMEYNIQYIKKYFIQLNCSDCLPYLKYFATCKMDEEIRKRNVLLSRKYSDLNGLLNITVNEI